MCSVLGEQHAGNHLIRLIIPVCGEGKVRRKTITETFHMLKRSGRTDAQVLEELANTVGDWTTQLV